MAVILSTNAQSESTLTALQLAERLLALGNRVTVYARESATSLTTGDSDLAQAIAALLRRGVHGATLDWVVDQHLEQDGAPHTHVPGVIPGSCVDVWRFVRSADVVLNPPGVAA